MSISTARYIQSYCHTGRIGVLVELGFKDPVSARTEELLQLSKDLAMHIAASEPESIEALLVEPFVKDTTTTIGQHISAISQALQEEIVVARFVRWSNDPSQPSELPHRNPPSPSAPAVALRVQASNDR